MLVTICALIAVVLLLWTILLNVGHKVPGAPVLPLIGQMYLWVWCGDFTNVVLWMHKRYGPTCRIDMGFKGIMFSDPESVRQVTKSTKRFFRIGYNLSNVRIPGYSFNTDPLFNLQAAEWAPRRKFLGPVFAQAHIRRMVPGLLKTLWRHGMCVFRFEDDKPVDPMSALKHIFLTTVGANTLGWDFEENAFWKGKSVRSVLDRLTQRQIQESATPTMLFPMLNWTRPKNHKEEVEWVNALLTEIVNKYQELPDDELAEKDDILSKLVLATREETADTVKLNIAEVKDELLQFIIAGYDTSATTTAWTLYYLGKNPERQEEVFQEVQNKLDIKALRGDPENPDDVQAVMQAIVYDDLTKKTCPLLAATVSETQRHMPIFPLLDRRVEEDQVIDGVQLRKGDVMCASFIIGQHNPEIWGNTVDEWIPDRWVNPGNYATPEQIKQQRTVHTPFGAGPRACIGMQVAEIEVRALLASILARFVVEVPKDAKRPKIKDALTEEPVGLQLRFRPRNLE